jgi:DNA polymerase/3'-5' exonuclease PolX
VVRTGGRTTNQRIAVAAIRKNWHLQAYGAGFSTPDGDVVCKSERDVFELVDLRYLDPWERE